MPPSWVQTVRSSVPPAFRRAWPEYQRITCPGSSANRRGAAWKRCDSASAELEHHPLVREPGLRAVRARQRNGASLELLERRIAVLWIVVEEHELLRTDGPPKGDGVGDARVATADALGVLVLEELRVVEQDIRPGGQ